MTAQADTSRAGRIGLVLILIAAVGAFAFRLPLLDRRPMHGDEANQAVKTGILLETGEYAYDPVEHHGPTLYYLTLPVAWLSGTTDFEDTTEFTFRIIPVIFGIGIVLLLIPLRHTLGTLPVTCAAILTAVSPAMVYYSRYYIQEMLLVCFIFGIIVCGWRYVETRSLRWAIAAGVFAGLAHASKETCIIAFAGIASAGLVTALVYKFSGGRPSEAEPDSARKLHSIIWHTVAFLVAAISVSVVFYSSFFTHLQGIADSVLTYANYFDKADSNRIHDKPWYYYLSLLAHTRRTPWPVFSEGLILGLGILGIATAATGLGRGAGPRERLLLFLALYTLFMTAVYSFIPYKTPWNALNFLQPCIVLAGVGAVWLVRIVRFRVIQAIVVLLLISATGQLAMQSYRASYVFPADVRNPYVYAHTSTALLKLVERVNDIAGVYPDDGEMLIRVITLDGDYWPLPWYLRKFPNVGYWRTIPEEADAAVILAPAKLKSAIDPHLSREYQVDTKSLRPGVLWVIEIRKNLWEKFMASRG